MKLDTYIYKDGNDYYFDTENYYDSTTSDLSIQFDDGDLIKWTWENKKMIGTLRRLNFNGDLFLIKNPTEQK